MISTNSDIPQGSALWCASTSRATRGTVARLLDEWAVLLGGSMLVMVITRVTVWATAVTDLLSKPP